MCSLAVQESRLWISKDINKTTIETNFDKNYKQLAYVSKLVSIVVYDYSSIRAMAKIS